MMQPKSMIGGVIDQGDEQWAMTARGEFFSTLKLCNCARDSPSLSEAVTALLFRCQSRDESDLPKGVIRARAIRPGLSYTNQSVR